MDTEKLSLWTSEEFLKKYFYQCKFNDRYSKATGSIAGQWVRNPWDGKMKEVIFNFVREYVNKNQTLPEGEHSFKLDWGSGYLKDVLLKDQIVTFPRLTEVKYD
jgi:hypothetical protein